jgi:hypothetical protein
MTDITSGANTGAKFDLSALDQVAQSNAGFEFEYISEAYGATGIFFSVVGEQADVVKEWVRKRVDQSRYQDNMRKLKNKDYVKPFKEDEQDSRESAAIRIVGWRGLLKDVKAQVPEPVPFSYETALHLCTVNQEIFNQVLKNSNDFSNLSKAKVNA